MKATATGLGALLALTLLAPLAQAQCCYLPPPQAPDACGPGYYCNNLCGLTYGPNHCVYPPFPPFNGMVFGPAGKGGCGPGAFVSPYFPTHPYARSPRDYFMVYDP
jgi:hypothetical protein